MFKIIRFLLLIFILSFSVIFSQGIEASSLFSEMYKPTFASKKTNLLNSDGGNLTNYNSLTFAKINYFGIDNLEQKNDAKNNFKENDSSFWDNEIIYFAVGVIAASALYIVWQNSGSENPPQKTFGLPPKPKGKNDL